jgi:glyoxylase-like metal-dependent hydrolase (beta-lactamase superfamily II)
MYFKQVLNERCGCASYVIASRKTRKAVVIDPAIDTEPYEALLRERDFRLRYAIDTHIHADHVSGARRLAAAQGPSCAWTRRHRLPIPSARSGTGRSWSWGNCACASCTLPATDRS